jgi:hypothetical protein
MCCIHTHAGGYGAHHHHHPHHMGAPAKQLLSAQFMPEGLRQQLQQSNSLIQVQVSKTHVGLDTRCCWTWESSG